MSSQSIIRAIEGDITKISVDVIVNAANSTLLGGGGVDGAIHRAGGPDILAECRLIHNRQGGCATGSAVMTTAGNLPAKKVIHTVGPVWVDGHHNEPDLLFQCYRNSLLLATAQEFRSIAFPNISTGVYGYPKHIAAEVAINAVRNFLEQEPSLLDEVVFVCYDYENYRLYKDLM